tara:strand:+ start:102 stop:629 length:528 start_codon:yes stop_codon:yes gene_type:complete
MSKVNILKITTTGIIKEIPIQNDIKHFNTLISKDINIYLLYWWLLDGDKYEAYGNIEQEECIEKNNHKLPMNGLSDLLEENSNTICIYGNIYIIKFNNNNIINITTTDYGEFYNILSLEDECSQSDNEYDLYGEELIEDKDIKNNDYFEEEDIPDKYLLNNELELGIDDNLYLKI